MRAQYSANIERLKGDYGAYIAFLLQTAPSLVRQPLDTQAAASEIAARPGQNGSAISTVVLSFGFLQSWLHDLRPARRILLAEPDFTHAVLQASARLGGGASSNSAAKVAQEFQYLRTQIALGEEDWKTLLAAEEQVEAAEPPPGAGDHSSAVRLPTEMQPLAALALAHMGDFARAHAVIDKTPADCDLCLRVRGKIDALENNYAGAAFWFQRATALAPSIPFAFHDWGNMLLKKGDPAGAIEKFKHANRKGPRFADPLEGWGEALMAQNRSDLALAKFAQAEQYAPNWGRLHLKWGEALAYAGKKNEAQKQFATAPTLDLTPSEKSELSRMAHV